MRVVTYNVLDGATGRESLVLEVLRAAAPDVVVLQEVLDAAFVGRLAEALEMKQFFALGNTKHHLALLSRWPIAASRSHRVFPSIRTTVLEATIEHPSGHRLNVFGVHPVPFPNLLLELWRLWEIKMVLRHVRQLGPSHCVVVGDFNAIAPGDNPHVDRLGAMVRTMILLQGGRIFRFAIRAMLRAGMADCFRDLHPDADGFTYGPPSPTGRIDYIFANAAMRTKLRECSVVRRPPAVDLASDHYPVLAEFVL
jgi:endonuclease/exonuclease/phosphatase family metal-dependent hydrolase